MASFLIIFQDFFDAAGDPETLGVSINMHTVRRVCLSFILLGVMLGFILMLSIVPASYAAAGQKAKWKKSVVKAILRQDVGWFDTSKPL